MKCPYTAKPVYRQSVVNRNISCNTFTNADTDAHAQMCGHTHKQTNRHTHTQTNRQAHTNNLLFPLPSPSNTFSDSAHTGFHFPDQFGPRAQSRRHTLKVIQRKGVGLSTSLNSPPHSTLLYFEGLGIRDSNGPSCELGSTSVQCKVFLNLSKITS